MGVVLILVGVLVALWPAAGRFYGAWGGVLRRVPVVPFALFCGGLWLILRHPSQGSNQR